MRRARARPRRRGRTRGLGRGTVQPAAAHGARGWRPSRSSRARRPPAPTGATRRELGVEPGRAGAFSSVVGLLSRRRAAHGATRSGCRSARGRRRRRDAVGWLASPTRCIDGEQPVAGPVTGEHPPVRLAPWAAGASPTTSTCGLGDAEARDRAAPVGLVGVRRPLLARDLLAPRAPGGGSGGSRRCGRRGRRASLSRATTRCRRGCRTRRRPAVGAAALAAPATGSARRRR